MTTNRKQSAHTRREVKALLTETITTNTLNNTAFNSFINTASQSITNLQNTNTVQTTQIENHTSLIDNLDSRVYTLETAPPPSGGGGGIDPSDPEPIIISENYVSQMQDWVYSGGGIQILSTTAYGQTTSARIFQTAGSVSGFGGNNMYIVASQSEVDHPGVIEIVVEDQVQGVLSLSQQTNTTICAPSDVTRMIAVIKTPVSFPSNSSFVVGFATDLSSPSEGMYFVADPASNTWTPTANNGTSSTTGATTALATNTWYTLEITKVTSTSFDFTINGSTVNISTNVPTNNLNCGFWLDNSSGPSPSQLKLKLDFFSLKLRDTAGAVLPTGATVIGTANEVEVSYNSGTMEYIVGLPNSITVTEANLTNVNFVTTTTGPTPVKGQLIWDEVHGTVVIGVNSNVHIPLGEASMINVRNSSGVSISKGDIVYVSGSHATGFLEVTKAQANAEATSAPTIGLAAEAIAHNNTGFVITQGLLTGLTTNTYPIGQPIFLSESVAGGWRTTFPTAPNHGTFVGWIVKSAGLGAGSMYVKIHNYNELSELSDVYIPSTPTNNDILQWDGTDLRWENRTLATAGIAAASHTHALSDITQSGAALNNVPQWNGTNWVPAAISASPGGSTGQVQYNNAGAFDGATNVKINSNNLELVKPTSEPTTAPADSVIMYAKSFGQRDLPAFVDSSGWSANLQTCIARNKFTQFNFNGNTNTASINNGMVITTTTVGTAGTAGGAVPLTTTSLLGGSRRQTYLTSTTAGSATGWRASVAQCWRGNAVNRGGFFCVWKFGIGDAVLTAGGTLFVGLNDSTAAPVTAVIQNPRTTTDNTMRNQVGLVLADGSLVYQICHRNGTTAATSISTGVTANLTDIIEFCLYCAPNDTTIHYYLKVYADSGSNTEFFGNIGTGANIPANTTQFVPHMWRSNNVSSTALAVHALSFSIETPH